MLGPMVAVVHRSLGVPIRVAYWPEVQDQAGGR